MRPNAIQMEPRNFIAMQRPDWFDDMHDPLLILQEREDEENGLSPQLRAANCTL